MFIQTTKRISNDRKNYYITIIDNCLETEQFIVKADNNINSAYASLLCAIVFYTKRNVYITQNILKCIFYLQGIYYGFSWKKILYLMEFDDLHQKLICPHINIKNQYLPLFKRMYERELR